MASGGDLTLWDASVSFNEAWNRTQNPIVTGAGVHIEPTGVLTAKGDSVLAGNHNNNHGAGGIYVGNSGSAIMMEDAVVGVPPFFPNTGDQGAGGALVEGTIEVHDNARIVGNIGVLFVGGVDLHGGTMRMFDSAEVSYNSASSSGRAGGVQVRDSGFLEIQGSSASPVVIEGNFSDAAAGGVAIKSSATAVLDEVTFRQNSAGGGCGGGLLAEDDVTATDVRFDGNDAQDCGGGIAILAGTFSAESIELAHNSASTDGGGLHITGFYSIMDGRDVRFVENDADQGGGLFVDDGDVHFELLEFTGNDAVTEGGAVRQRGGSLTLTGLDSLTNQCGARAVSSNTAGTMGGGLAISGGTTFLGSIDVTLNTAGTDGGGMALAYQADVTSDDTWYHDNAAAARGGGIAVLSSAPNTNPEVTFPAAMEDLCTCRTLAANEYCSEIRANAANGGGGGGIFMEDGTADVESTAFIGNLASAQGSAIGLRAHPTNGGPSMSATNVLVVTNGSQPSVDVVRVEDGLFTGAHVTAADNVGVPIRFAAGAGGSAIRRSIIWDTTLVEIDPALTIAAACTMFRGVPNGGSTSGPSQAFGLDPYFVTTPRGDYRLNQAISINAVNKCSIGAPFDLDGLPRAWLFDRGAFEAP